MALSKVIIALMVVVATMGVINGFTLPEDDVNEYNPYIYAIANEDQQAFNADQEFDIDFDELHRAKRQGSWTVEADRDQGQGTRLNVDGEGRLWTGNDGRSTLDGTIHYDRQFGGGRQDRENRDFRGGFRFEHKF